MKRDVVVVVVVDVEDVVFVIRVVGGTRKAWVVAVGPPLNEATAAKTIAAEQVFMVDDVVVVVVLVVVVVCGVIMAFPSDKKCTGIYEVVLCSLYPMYLGRVLFLMMTSAYQQMPKSSDSQLSRTRIAF
jgi:uncharacterized membrane-anchored protein